MTRTGGGRNTPVRWGWLANPRSLLLRNYATVLTASLCAVAPSRLSCQTWDTLAAPSPTERAVVLAKMHSAIDKYFAHWEAIPAYRFEPAFEAYADEAMRAPDRRSFDLASIAFMASLNNGHTEFWDAWLFKHDGQPFGFHAEPVAHGWVVTDSRLSSIVRGDVIVAVDGEPVEQTYTRLRRYIVGSNDRWKRHVLFSRSYLFPQHVSLRLANGRAVDVTRSSDLALPIERSTTFRVADSVAYIRIPSFVQAAFEDSAVAFIHRFRSYRGIVIDVRGNHGGSTPVNAIGALMNEPWRSFVVTTPQAFPLFQYYGATQAPADSPDGIRAEAYSEFFQRPALHVPSAYTQPLGDAYQGTVIILANGGCFSACEGLVVSFKDNHRATIVGDTTGGSSGQQIPTVFRNGMGFGVSAKREYMPDGQPFEGVGIPPDVFVSSSPAATRDGDPALELAMKLARQSHRTAPSSLPAH